MKRKQTIKKWLLKNFKLEQIKDIANRGCSGGVMGLTYYSETTWFYSIFKVEIWGILEEAAENQDISVLKLIAESGGADNVCGDETFKNQLCWIAVEIIAREIIRND